MATGMLDHSAGIAKVAGAAPVVFHPGFLLGRTHKQTVSSVVSQLADFRKRIEAKDRGVPFGVEIMGRVNDFGSLDDILAISSRLGWVRPVIDFAHLHATSDGAFTTVKAFHAVLASANRVLPRGAPFHIHFSDIAYANRNETKHLPYGEGTLRVAPLGKALARFPRPATVISEAPGEESHQAIRAELFSAAGKSTARRSSSRSASSSRPRSRRN
jgi:deoxyribonuclease-4